MNNTGRVQPKDVALFLLPYRKPRPKGGVISYSRLKDGDEWA